MTPGLYHRGQIDNAPPEWADDIGIDWLSLTGPDEAWADRAESLLATLCDGAPEPLPGRHNYRQRVRWPCGVSLLRAHTASGGMVEMPGGACGILGGRVVHQFMQEMLIGGRCTRIDPCRDFHSATPLTILHDVLASCDRRQLPHGRGYKEFYESDSLGNKALSGVYLGSSKSSRFIRVYDKGIETGTDTPGCWIRWETQLREDHANNAAFAIASVDDWSNVAASIAMSVADFRVNNGDPHVSRRPRPQWYARLCDGLDYIRPRLNPSPSTLEGFRQHAERSVFRTIVAASREAGIDPKHALDILSRDVEPTEATYKNPTVYLLAQHLRRFNR